MARSLKKLMENDELKRIHISLPENELKIVDAEATKMNMNRSEYIRLALDRMHSSSAATTGMDEISKALRRVLQDEQKSQFDRLAKMIAKDTKASATSMNLLLYVLSNQEKKENPELDILALYQSAEKRGVAYLNQKE